MNREIKFRAKVYHNPQKVYLGSGCQDGEWVYGDLHLQTANPHIHIKEHHREPIDVETIGQFTGLYDKKGKEVYEGDIIRIKEFKNLLMQEFSDDDSRFDLFTLDEIKGEQRDEYVSPVVWHDGCFDVSTNGAYFDMWIASIFGDMKRSSPLFEFEIIGNIYENADIIPHALLSYIDLYK